ncbi:olfactory receptor 51F2-like [Lampetra fluviatilis]
MHSTMWLLSVAFASLVLYLMLKSRSLRQKLRFFLLMSLIISQVIFNSIQVVFYILLLCQYQLSRAMCAVYFLILFSTLNNELFSVMAMSVDRYVAICWSLRYNEICSTEKYWKIIVGVVGLSIVWPGLRLMNNLLQKNSSELNSPVACSLDVMDPPGAMGDLVTALILGPIVMAILINFGCYCCIYLEGKRSGNLDMANKRARKTVMYHLMQISFFVMPMFLYYIENAFLIMTSPVVQNLMLFQTVVFGVAQGLSPIVYGLRARELRETLLRVFCTNRRIGEANN